MNELTEKKQDLFSAFSIKPQNFDEAMKICKLISESDFAPKDFKGKPGNVFAAACMGEGIGLSLMQSIQNIAVINGRPSVYGDIGVALLLANGCRIESSDVEEIRKSGIARCKITRPDGRMLERSFSVEDAKQANLLGKPGPWTTNTQRQMAWRAFWFCARDVAADLLKGISGREEVEDFNHIIDGEAVSTSDFMPKRIEKAQERETSKLEEFNQPEDKNPEPEANPTEESFAEQTESMEKNDPNPSTVSRFDRSKMSQMNAKFTGKCHECGGAIAKDESIFYERVLKKAFHLECPYVPE